MKLKDYNSIPNFLIRKTLIHIGRLHIRIHRILSPDKSPYVHNHPFYYISIILKGGYTEELLINDHIKTKKHGFLSVIYRKPSDFHRIKSINGPTSTLFFTFKIKMNWKLKRNPEIDFKNYKIPEYSGIFIRTIKNKTKYYKFNEFWFIGHDNIGDAMKENRLSIHQSDEYEFK